MTRARGGAVEPLTYTLEEAAAAVGLDRRTVVDMLKAGVLRGNRAGRRWRISRASVREWVESRPGDNRAAGGTR